MDLRIRSLRRDELEEAWQLHEQGFPCLDVVKREDYLKRRSRPEFDLDQIVVAESDGELVGKIEVYPWLSLQKARRGFIDGFVVIPAYRRQGIGTRLLLEAERRASQKGMVRIDLFVKTSNIDVIALYEKMGYLKLLRVFFLKASTSSLKIPEPPAYISVRPVDLEMDPQNLAGMRSCFWWVEHPTYEALKADIGRSPESFLVLDHGGRAEAYVKFGLNEVVRINALGITPKLSGRLPVIVKAILGGVLLGAAGRRSIYIEVDEQEKELLDTLASLGFEVYGTELHMEKLVP